MTNRTCRRCGVAEADAAAAGIKFKKDRNMCCACASAVLQGWRSKNPQAAAAIQVRSRLKHADERKEAGRSYYRENREDMLAYEKARWPEYKPKIAAIRQASPENFIRNRCRVTYAAAKRRNLAYALIEKDLVSMFYAQSGRCAITRLQMTHTNGPCQISIDRKDSSVGYVPDNVHLVCKWVNLAKQSLPCSEITDLILLAAQSMAGFRVV